MGLCCQPRLSLDVQQGLSCQEPFPGQGPDQNKIRSIYLIPDCSKPISTVIYSASGSLVLHLFYFVAEPVELWLDQIISGSAVPYQYLPVTFWP